MLIRKNACECNKCGKIDIVELDVFAANVILMGEEFYLCKDCIAPVMDYITSGKTTIEEKPMDLRNFVEYETVEKNEKPPEPEENEPKKLGDFTFGIDWKKKKTPVNQKDDWNPGLDKAREYTIWSDYEIEKIVDLYHQGLPWREIARRLKFTYSQLNCLVQHIRNPRGIVDNEKYKRWARQYPDVFLKPTTPRTTIDKLSLQEIEDILEKRGSGVTWVDIAKETGINRNTLFRMMERLEQSKPGDRTYDIAVKYGYVVE